MSTRLTLKLLENRNRDVGIEKEAEFTLQVQRSGKRCLSWPFPRK